MKYLKMLGPLVVAAAALMAFAGPASATITAPSGTAYSGKIHMSTTTGVWFHTGGQVTCGQSTLVGSVTKGETTVPIEQLTFSECGSTTFAVLKNGHMSIASDGTVSMDETEYTKLVHNIFIGTKHCILRMENTEIGKLTEGVDPAKLDTDTAMVPYVPTDETCSEAELTGEYTVNQPTGAITID